VPEDQRELVAEAGGELRGAIGIHPSAWREAVESIGPVAAAAAVALVIQQDLDGQKSGRIIKSPGGYYRAYVRKVAAGQIKLVDEIERFKRKRRH
jgi:replication initiation protein RepC